MTDAAPPRGAHAELWVVPCGEVAPAPHLFDTLSADEVARAERFRRPVDRDQYVMTRGALRTILARRLRVLPAHLAFAYSDHGKPSLGSPAAPLQFSVSHTHGLSIIGVTEAPSIGVDVEGEASARHLFDALTVAFSERELQLSRDWPEAVARRRLLLAWVVKEAILKADGRGLSVSPRDVELLAGLPALEGPGGGQCEALSVSWFVRAVEPMRGFVAAVASAAAPLDLAVREWGTSGA